MESPPSLSTEAPPPSAKGRKQMPQMRTKKETIQKRETRSKHEKKRREEMNVVLSEMMNQLPDDLTKFKLKRVDQKPRQPDKCFIIGSAVQMIRNSDYKPSLLTDPLTRDVFSLSNTFLIFLNNFIVADVRGDHRSIFDVDKTRMIGKDIRCFLDFESGSKVSFLNPAQQIINNLQLRSFMAKAMNCRLRNSQENPSEAVLVCVPYDLPTIPRPPVIPPVQAQPPLPTSPPPSKLEVDRPILAALLRRKDPPKCVSPRPSETTTSSCSFISPSSSTCSNAPLAESAVVRKSTIVAQKRKRIRTMNAIVESFPLDEEKGEKPTRKSKRSKTSEISSPMISATPASTMSSPIVSLPSSSLIQPIPTTTINPFDVLAPGYRDIWLRLQSERLLLEERISAKEGELKNLMQFVQPSPFLNFPHYLLPHGTLSAQNQ